jgi:hypothetical protein
MVSAYLLVAVNTTTQGVLFAPNLLPSRVRVRALQFQLFVEIKTASQEGTRLRESGREIAGKGEERREEGVDKVKGERGPLVSGNIAFLL